MEGLTEQEQKFFDSKGETEIEAEPEAEPEVKPEVKPETPEIKAEPEKKAPSKFTYSADTDNVVDEHGRKYIPHGAVKEEREANKKLRSELEDLKTKWTGGEKKLETLMKRLSGEEAKP